MNKVEAIRKLNAEELRLGIAGTTASWHQEYAKCPFVYAGGLPTAFTEGDLLAIFEQYGTIVHVNLVRDADTGKSRGFAFLQYHDTRSAVLAVDNFTGVEVGPGRTLRVDHARDYSVPEDGRSAAIDTTPLELKESSTRMVSATFEGIPNSGTVNGHAPESLSAEVRREKAVLERLKAMRKHRKEVERQGSEIQLQSKLSNGAGEMNLVRNDKKLDSDIQIISQEREDKHGTSPGVAARIEKARRRKEKEERRAERAKIRDGRKRRRSERENVT